MTIAELKELISELPDDMTVVLPTGEEMYTTACFEQTEIVDFPIEADNPDGYEYIKTLVIRPCTCYVEDLPVVPQEQVLN